CGLLPIVGSGDLRRSFLGASVHRASASRVRRQKLIPPIRWELIHAPLPVLPVREQSTPAPRPSPCPKRRAPNRRRADFVRPPRKDRLRRLKQLAVRLRNNAR